MIPQNSQQLSEYLYNSPKGNFFLIAGPCAIENESTPLFIAEKLKSICEKLEIPFVFKGSYRKANRSRYDSFTGIGDEKALKILESVRNQFDVPILTDIHETQEADMAADVVDILQIPAFLCRQTELLKAAASTGKIINIKKGQFLSPQSMLHAVEKVRHFGNNNVTVTERGTTFGYQDLIVDPRSIPMMRNLCNCPVIMDITHSLQQPNQTAGVTGGLPELISIIGRSAIAVGADGIFIETHPNPAEAKCDGANMLQLDDVESLLKQLIIIRQAVNKIDKLL